MTIENWQQVLVQNHPNLFICRSRDLAFSPGYPTCPDGWRQVVAIMVARVSEAAKGHPVQFCEISERCGRLRIYWRSESALPKGVERCIEDAIALGEARSACSCATYGAEGRQFLTSGGRLLPLCSEHARGEPMPARPGSENVHLVRAFIGEKMQLIALRRYDRDHDRFIDVSPSA